MFNSTKQGGKKTLQSQEDFDALGENKILMSDKEHLLHIIYIKFPLF